MFTNNLKVGKCYRLLDKKIFSFLKVGDVFEVTCIEKESKRFRYEELNKGTFYFKNKKHGGGTFISKVDINYYRFEEVNSLERL